MEEIQECLDEAKKLLQEYGLRVVTEISPTWNKRDGFDFVYQNVYVGEDVIYNSQTSTMLSKKDEDSYDGYGIRALSSCVAISQDLDYQRQAYEFKSAIKELLELKKKHKFTKSAEKHELKEKCEKLCYFGRLPSGPNDTKRVNVPLLEDNLKNIKEALEKLRALEAEKQAEVAAAQAGPANE